MHRFLATTSAVVLGTGTAFAGGVDRSGQSIAIIFEEGNRAELAFGTVSPDLSGVQVINLPGSPAGSSSGNMVDDFRQLSAAYKHDFGNGLSGALIFDQPFGADVDYPGGTYFAAGSTAELNTNSLTAVLRYKMPSNFSLHGGLRYQTLEATAIVPFVTSPLGPLAGTPYEADGEADAGVGYLIGAAYEIPAIAARIALTYNSRIEHNLDTVEDSVLGLGRESNTEIETPQSVNLEFQTGVAPDTLLFGGVRWVDWDEFDISPADYLSLADQALVSFEEDTWTYTLGVGRQFTEQFSGALSVSYEPQVGGFAANLGPSDGRTSVTLGGTYRIENVSITGGVSYAWLGDAETQLSGAQAGDFTDNEAIGVGIEIGYNF
ncbi:OmpP1/FadL family transporter [Roseitranquillus sediminis]|uniref:OmpP1/FadL family transporter n=1 Tax=Roseitranquillus sediminis TaxID=2809051 RepID=UPI001D0C611D|nr:outer membrane protein transport protein [Roseitranquillus sediminis]MBM9595534.1 outer membrane protein transport protein [Roseitranquillus sediminis]